MSVNRRGLPSILVVSLLVYSLKAGGNLVFAEDRNFAEDVDFLARHTEVVVLGRAEGPQIVVAPAYQGRVMTSTAAGGSGVSYGWINYEQVAAGVDEGAQINVFGGEERIWLGPEGGQYSIFFAPGVEFEFANWQTPALVDAVAFEVVQRDAAGIAFRHDATVTNYSGAPFDLRIDRRVELMTAAAVEASLGTKTGNLSAVGYRSTNRLTNQGQQAWTKEAGLLSIWILGMYKPGRETTIVIPFRQGPAAELGPIVNDAYFGKVPADRLQTDDGVIYFSADGGERGKIGLAPQRATPICGSYDGVRKVLTIVKYNQPGPEATDYVNSLWKLQDEPYGGDVLNAYNDGPPAPGVEPLGPFYELETSSPALALGPGESGKHIQETFHFEGDEAELDALSRELLGVSLAEIRDALP